MSILSSTVGPNGRTVNLYAHDYHALEARAEAAEAREQAALRAAEAALAVVSKIRPKAWHDARCVSRLRGPHGPGVCDCGLLAADGHREEALALLERAWGWGNR